MMRMPGKCNFVLILALLFRHVMTNNMCIKPSNDEIDKKLAVSQFMVLFEIGLKMCFKECEAYAMCLSINFNRKMLMCELNSQKKNESLLLVDDSDFIYKDLPGIFDYRDKKCGNGSCNQHSKCVQTRSNNSVCIAIGCAEPVPDLKNGQIAEKSFSPPSVTFECNPGHKGVSTNTITCPPGGKWSSLPYRCEPVDCEAIVNDDANMTSRDAVYRIYHDPLTSRDVYCDMTTDGGGWTVIQRRFDGSLNFQEDWEAYKNGFGTPYQEYWLGNDKIHALTSGRNQELRIDMGKFTGSMVYARYSHFSVESESSKYRLSISDYSGNAGDMMINAHNLNGMYFTTKDRDNENDNSQNCAINPLSGGWWYNHCAYSALNGVFQTSNTNNHHGIFWGTNHENMKSTKMMIRSKKSEKTVTSLK
ncbi:ficolin-1-like [Ostrea edulis]|uniref:ficolin-1-like n=1 Tax=Ostrea edulis TaxID=37623 RepID=UPI0024AF7F02|nr:ficolin-1-like [Ostrea edulis]